MSGSTRGPIPLYIDKVLGNWRYIPGTKTFNSLADGSFWRIKRRIDRAAWRREPLKTKLSVVSLWLRQQPVCRLKAAYRKIPPTTCRAPSSLRPIGGPRAHRIRIIG